MLTIADVPLVRKTQVHVRKQIRPILRGRTERICLVELSLSVLLHLNT